MCLNTKGSYLCRCHEDYENNVVVGAMTGKDCRAKGDPANIIVAADDQLVQVALHGAGVNRHAAAQAENGNDIVAIAFDARRELQYWIDGSNHEIYRASEPRGNQSHVGQRLDLDFASLHVTPTDIAVDYLTGNIFITTVSHDGVETVSPARVRRMSEPIQNTNTGAVYVALSDGRYLKKIIDGNLQIPTAIVSLPSLGRICYADAGLHAKIECADMDGTHREVIVKDLVFSPTSMAVDEGKGNRIYWADPKYRKVDSVNPDGSHRVTVVHSTNLPWAIDVFENYLYWVSRETNTLYVQDKFGRGRVSVLASNLEDVHAVRVSQRYARDTIRAKSSCSDATCSHICVELPNSGFSCLCPDNGFPATDGSCSMARVDALVIPRQCSCVNGGICKLDGSCECSSDFEGENCQKSNTVSRKLIGRISENLLLALFFLLALFVCIGLVGFFAVNMYRKRALLSKKNEAADSTVSFHGNVISFSNPALENKQDPHPIEYSMQQISSLEPGSTTFSNPVYDLETDSTAVLPIENTPSTSHLASFHSRDRTGGDVIVLGADITSKPVVPPRQNKVDKDKTILLENPVFEAEPSEISDV